MIPTYPNSRRQTRTTNVAHDQATNYIPIKQAREGLSDPHFRHLAGSEIIEKLTLELQGTYNTETGGIQSVIVGIVEVQDFWLGKSYEAGKRSPPPNCSVHMLVSLVVVAAGVVRDHLDIDTGIHPKAYIGYMYVVFQV